MRSFFMERRYMVVLSAIVTVVFVSSLVLPAFGAPSPLTLAKRALTTAKKANRTAVTANRRATRALAQDGQPGPQGPQGPQGTQGPQGFQGSPGTARAYARFSTTHIVASLDTARSTPGTTVTHLAAGRYCVTFPGSTGANSATQPAVATANNNISPDDSTGVAVAEVVQPPGTGCAAPGYEIQTKAEGHGASGLFGRRGFMDVHVVVP